MIQCTKVIDKPWIVFFLVFCNFYLLCSQDNRPNIVIIYADDMGYGDLNCQNPDSKIPTPHLDQLASEGMRFTDAHSSSGICSPSRFALLTGMYHWRRQHGIVGAFGPPFFDDEDVTLPAILREEGYQTACMGKWHLGWDWEFKNEPSLKVEQWGRERSFYAPEDVEWSASIKGGPLARGFDYYFGDGTINFPPYTWVENERILIEPTEVMDINDVGYETKEGRWEFRPGPKAKEWNPYEVLPTLTEKAVSYIENRNRDTSFFLYFALPSPHAPIIPNDEFDGKSQAGAYGDFVFQSDHVVGEIVRALKDQELYDNTIIIFTADNGPESYAWARARDYDHFSMGTLRGLKRDVWEGGHRVPFIVKWSEVVPADTISEEVISQIDIFATLTSLLNIKIDETVAPDSYDLSALLKGQNYSSPIREALIHNTYESIWGIRKGNWLLIDHSSGGHRKMPDYFNAMRKYQDFDTEAILFNMKVDPEQMDNLFDKYPSKVKELELLLQQYKSSTKTAVR